MARRLQKKGKGGPLNQALLAVQDLPSVLSRHEVCAEDRVRRDEARPSPSALTPRTREHQKIIILGINKKLFRGSNKKY